MESRHFHLLEHFTVILNDKTSDLEFVDKARKSCLAKTMENTPLMQDALLQHDKCVGYQGQPVTYAQQPTPPPEGHSWRLDSESNSWIPVFILPITSQACTELVKSGCKSKNGCGAKCSCNKAL